LNTHLPGFTAEDLDLLLKIGRSPQHCELLISAYNLTGHPLTNPVNNIEVLKDIISKAEKYQNFLNKLKNFGIVQLWWVKDAYLLEFVSGSAATNFISRYENYDSPGNDFDSEPIEMFGNQGVRRYVHTSRSKPTVNNWLFKAPNLLRAASSAATQTKQFCYLLNFFLPTHTAVNIKPNRAGGFKRIEIQELVESYYNQIYTDFLKQNKEPLLFIANLIKD
jgi:hypothetical protein